MELSIIFKDGAKCNMNCSYCSGHLIEKDDIKIDYEAMLKTFNENDNIKNDKEINVNIWGGEPLIKIDKIRELMAFLEDYFKDRLKFYFISTNGIPLANKEVIDFLYEVNNRKGLKLQISHDGLGQKYRSQNFDPFYSESTKDNVIKLAKDGIFDLINCTMSGKNCSMKGNMFYFNKWMFDNNLNGIEVKLNHINDSDYSKEFNLSGKNLRTYIHEYEQILMDTYLMEKNKNVSKEYAPYIDYFTNQINRDNICPNGEFCGGCAYFSTGKKDDNWCMNTLGEYVPCQLWDTPIGIQNPNIEMPEYCKDCEYNIYMECHPCPNNTYPEECEYRKEFVRMILRLKKYRNIVDFLFDKCNKDCNCNGNGCCENGECACRRPE